MTDKEVRKLKAKKKTKDMVFPVVDQPCYLSAQDYALLSDFEKVALDEMLVEEGYDPELYKERMKRLFPKEYRPSAGRTNALWRNK